MKWCNQDPQSVYPFIAVDLSTGLKYSLERCSVRKLLVKWRESSHQDDYEGGEYNVVRYAERSGLIQSLGKKKDYRSVLLMSLAVK